MKRLLCILNGLNRGGAETFMTKLCHNIDKEKYKVDFCVSDKHIGAYEEEIKKLGNNVFHVTMKSGNPVKCFYEIKNLVKKEKYENVLLVNEQSLSVIDLIAARFGGAKKCSMRSTNANLPNRKLNYLHKVFKPLSMYIPDVMLAPSSEAGEFTFGKRNVKNGCVHILNNGLSYQKYEFNTEKRNKLRSELNLDNKFVVGHVGRFSKQKNHDFLIEVFYEIAKKNESAVLVLIGTGEKQQEVLRKVKALSIEDKVLFFGLREDVPDVLSAFDVLVFPSFFEGMPNVVIEAQASGLPCLISDTITPEADITGLVKYLSLEKSANEWAEEAIVHSMKFERRSYKEEFIAAGYDIESVVQKFVDLVF